MVLQWLELDVDACVENFYLWILREVAGETRSLRIAAFILRKSEQVVGRYIHHQVACADAGNDRLTECVGQHDIFQTQVRGVHQVIGTA